MSATLPRSPSSGTDIQLAEIAEAEYVLGAELARGGMGRIRIARDARLGRNVAIKEVLTRDGELARRFECEARITARLQHPSIVSVYEAGRWPNGMPFYAMPLIDGRSLDDVIAECSTLDQRLAWIPNVMAIADAIAYAHEERVIHRDLKPRNVLVGRFGQTVVIDWGLAKDLAAGSGAEKPRVPCAAGDALATELGEVIGTPAYMPPEQADGATVDERADVYAIGALLFHVLTGNPPYTGRTAIDVLEQVRSQPPEPLSRREPGTPRELVAIVERAMARDPAQRYPSARELAEDLRRFQTGQLVGAHRYTRRQLVRRWLRRHRALAFAALSIAIVGTIAIERVVHAKHVADDQRELAVASRADVEHLLAFMVGDLHEKLEPIGRLDVLEAAARRALEYYAAHERELDYHELLGRANQQLDLGDVMYSSGHIDEAIVQDRAAIASFERGAAMRPLQIPLLVDLASAHQRVGDLLQEQGKLDDAAAEYAVDLAMDRMIAVMAPDDDVSQQGLAFSHLRTGDMLVRRGDRARAEPNFQAMLAIGQQLARRSSDTTPQKIQYFAHQRLATLVSSRDPAAAVAQARAALAAARTLVEREPDNAFWKRLIADAQDQLGGLLLANGALDEADEVVKAARTRYAALVAADPLDSDSHWGMVAAAENLGRLAAARGDTPTALAEFREALAIVEPLAAKDPTYVRWQQALATEHAGIGNALLALRDQPGAIRELELAAKLADALAQRVSGDAELASQRDEIRAVLARARAR